MKIKNKNKKLIFKLAKKPALGKKNFLEKLNFRILKNFRHDFFESRTNFASFSPQATN